MIPLTLNISGFLSYRDPVEIDFSLFDLACIAGGNGAGKSSILDAMTWSLFGQARKRDDSLINLQSNTAEVDFTFIYEANTYRVQRINPRGKTTVVEFHILTPDGLWKPLTERTSRATQARIEETLGLDYETFVSASFFLQGKADRFTQQRSADRKKTLASILGLEIWEEYRRRAVSQRKTAESKISETDGRLEEVYQELSEEDDRKQHYQELKDQLDRLSIARDTQKEAYRSIERVADSLAEREKLVHQIQRQMDAANEKVEQTETRLKDRTQERDSYNEILAKEEQIKSGYQELISLREELTKFDEIARQFAEFERKRQEPNALIREEEAKLTNELKHLDGEINKLSDEVGSIPQILESLDETKKSLDELEAKLDQKEKLEQELQEGRERLKVAETENPRLKEEMETLKSQIGQLEDLDEPDCPLCGQSLKEDERKTLLEELSQKGKTKGDRYRENVALLKQSKEFVRTMEEQIREYANLDAELRHLTRTQDQLAERLSTARQSETELARLGEQKAALLDTLAKKSFAAEARAALAEVDAELKKIGYDAAAHDATREQVKAAQPVEGEYRSLENARAALAPISREIAELEAEYSKLQEEAGRLTEEHTDAAASYAADSAQAPDLAEENRKLRDLEEQTNQLRLDVGSAKQKVDVLTKQKEKKTQLEGERETYTARVGEYKELERAFGKDGVPALLIEQALPQIENKANEILDRLSGGNMSIRFITQREYKDTKREDLKETLDIQISDSVGTRDYEMFSGGEAFRVNFAIRLALSEILAQRAGAKLQTLVIDEGFGSQDAIGRQRLIEAINLVRDDFEKILVITHIDSLKDAFPNRIEVTKTPRGSVIEIT